MKTNLNFILDILNSHIEGYALDSHNGLLTQEQRNEREIALKQAGKAIIEYVEQANRLTKL